MLFFDIISVILVFIDFIFIAKNMEDAENKIYNNKNYSDRKWSEFYISWILTEINIIYHGWCSYCLLQLIKAKTNICYLDYAKQQISTIVNIYNIPQSNLNINQLSFVGYDKDQHPINTGNNQNITQDFFNSRQNLANSSSTDGNNIGNLFPPGK